MNKDSIGKNKPGGSVSQQIDRALASGEQFGMLLLPGENEPRWFGKGYGSGMMTMEVAPWLAPFASRLVIGDGDTATTTIAAGTPPPAPIRCRYTGTQHHMPNTSTVWKA